MPAERRGGYSIREEDGVAIGEGFAAGGVLDGGEDADDGGLALGGGEGVEDALVGREGAGAETAAEGGGLGAVHGCEACFAGFWGEGEELGLEVVEGGGAGFAGGGGVLFFFLEDAGDFGLV